MVWVCSLEVKKRSQEAQKMGNALHCSSTNGTERSTERARCLCYFPKSNRLLTVGDFLFLFRGPLREDAKRISLSFRNRMFLLLKWEVAMAFRDLLIACKLKWDFILLLTSSVIRYWSKIWWYPIYFRPCLGISFPLFELKKKSTLVYIFIPAILWL